MQNNFERVYIDVGSAGVSEDLLGHLVLHVRGEEAPLAPLDPLPDHLPADLPHLLTLAPLLRHYDWPQLKRKMYFSGTTLN